MVTYLASVQLHSLSILTGISAGATEGVVIVPFDLIKVRLQDPASVRIAFMAIRIVFMAIRLHESIHDANEDFGMVPCTGTARTVQEHV